MDPGPHIGRARAVGRRIGRQRPDVVPDNRDETALPPQPDQSFAGLPELVADFAGRGLRVRFADRTAGHPVALPIQHLIHQLLRDDLAAAYGQRPTGQTLHARLRVDGDTLVLSYQTAGATSTSPTFTPDARHRQRRQARVDPHDGQILSAQTRDGNWLTIIRIPI